MPQSSMADDRMGKVSGIILGRTPRHGLRCHGYLPKEWRLASWRVDGHDLGGDHVRDVFHCDEYYESAWYFGAPHNLDQQSDDYEWERRMQSWSESLFNAGYVRSPGISLILEGGGSLGNEIDPENPGILSRGRMATTAAGHRNPYLLNWRIGPGDLYEFFTPAPPNQE
ncbi:hypothetical protein K4F52_009523 [Lecanicillium sp. MT-2017a]|nr:hypothetical protein K4F52_009523 [Lecanicillium sp. MT-2017a]